MNRMLNDNREDDQIVYESENSKLCCLMYCHVRNLCEHILDILMSFFFAHWSSTCMRAEGPTCYTYQYCYHPNLYNIYVYM